MAGRAALETQLVSGLLWIPCPRLGQLSWKGRKGGDNVPGEGRARLDTESTKTLPRTTPIPGSGAEDSSVKEASEFSLRKAIVKTAFQIRAV